MNRIVILGATSGIGLEIAKLYIAAGWQVGAAGRRTENLEALRAAAPDRVKIRSIDITAPEAAAAVDCRSGRLRPAAALRGHRLQQPAARRRTGNRNGGNQYRRVHAHHGHGFRLFPQAGRRTSGSDQFDRRDQRPRRSGGLLRQQTLPEHLSRRIGTTLTDATARHPHHRHPARIRGHTPAARREIPDAEKVAARIVRALEQRKRRIVIDRRYAVLVFFWRLIPEWLWERLPIRTK